MSNLLKKEKGFTLIEVVLVLAIAGLLLVIVFLALQGAQRSRRDTQRKNDASRMLASVESCASNANGVYTACVTSNPLVTATAPNTPYFAPNTGPSGSTYSVGATANLTTFVVTPNGLCGTVSHPVTVQIGQEAGATYCIGN
ncbi:type II secretion system protein [Candidatus Saccharibacteria bacterium]|nr:type II secretion system protein [Candidatus Saccharibacteria bacterium]